MARLIGTPPGYVGYEEGGRLTEAVDRRPYCVILLDEIEKAHPDVFNVLLQVLDEGRLTDGHGRTVDFRNTIVAMTSNIGSEYIQQLSESGGADLEIEMKVRDELKKHFRPEFLNRVDETVIFQRLTQDDLRHIVEIQAKGTGSSIPEVLRQKRVGIADREIVIQTRQELGLFEEQRALLAKLHDLHAFPGPVNLTIRFDCDRVYVYGLALLASWCARNAAKVYVAAAHSTVARYLDRIRLTDFAQNQVLSVEPHYDSENYVVLTPILRERKDEADLIASRLLHLFSRHVRMGREQGNALQVTFAELIENVYRHAQSDYPGFVIAQVHPTRRRLHVAIADNGIGVFDSFRRSDHEGVRRRAVSEVESLGMALEAYVTSKTRAHSGYGLYVVSDLAARNGGRFRLTSGRSSLLRQPVGLRRRIAQTVLDHLAWQGTAVGLMFDLSRSLPLVAVYNTLERDAEDYFD